MSFCSVGVRSSSRSPISVALTRTEFDALAEELADRGVTLETEDTDSSQLWLEVCGE